MRSAVGVFADATWGRDGVRPRAGMTPRVTATGDEPSVDLTTLDDGALVRAFQDGNRGAFDVIVVRHWPWRIESGRSLSYISRIIGL